MPNIFSKVGSAVSALWQKDSESVLGIDLGSSSIKLVQIKKRGGRAILETYGQIFLGPYADLFVGQATNLSPDKLAEALKDLFREANVTGKTAAISIPLSSSLVTLVDMPAPPDQDLGSIIPIEARKYVPVPISEVTLDWWIIPKKEEEASLDTEKRKSSLPSVEVLLVAIHNSILRRYDEVFNQMGLHSKIFEIETFSSIRSIFGHEMSPTMVLDIGASSTKISIVDYGIARISHTLSRGSQDITLAISRSTTVDFDRAEEAKRKGEGLESGSSILDLIFFEANQVLSAYQKKYRRVISKVMLIGGGSLMSGVPALAAKTFGVEIAYGAPFNKVETPAFLEKVLSQAGPEFAIAIGLALRRLSEVAV